MPPVSDVGHEEARRSATRYLEAAVLKQCQEFEQYYAVRIEQSAAQHERVLRQLGWGLAGIGVLGGGGLAVHVRVDFEELGPEFHLGQVPQVQDLLVRRALQDDARVLLRLVYRPT